MSLTDAWIRGVHSGDIPPLTEDQLAILRPLSPADRLAKMKEWAAPIVERLKREQERAELFMTCKPGVFEALTGHKPK